MISVKIAHVGMIASFMSPIRANWRMSNVSAVNPRVRMPTSIKAEPKNVYNTYFHAEYTRFPLPQTEIRKYIGTSSISQNRKNRTKSSALNTPRRLVSRTSSQAKYSLGLSSIRHEINTETSPRKAVNSASGKERPSSPTAYLSLIFEKSESSHVVLFTNWYPALSRS